MDNNELGTNLAEVGTDCISRQQAIETFKDCAVNGVGIDGIVDALKQLPSAQPEILACGEGELNVPDINVGDMISRQAAIEALRYAQHRFTVADEAGGMGTVKWSEYVIYFAAAERVLSDLPSAQPTQEIIHCKDCRFWKKYKYFNGKPTYAPFCGFNSIFTDDNDFCSRAEKRGEADG